MKRIFVLLALLAGFSAVANEARSPQAENDRDEEVAARAKHRMYPGGADEGDLKVQDPLPVPVRKVIPVVEEPRDESSAD
ncbi:MAG TPA: hypothetical protein PL182_06515 [Pseudobdellovibrionaceae bacterium]|nr:hypothetical protein [Pseudobdellovibrionaceae bacterium]